MTDNDHHGRMADYAHLPIICEEDFNCTNKQKFFTCTNFDYLIVVRVQHYSNINNNNNGVTLHHNKYPINKNGMTDAINTFTLCQLVIQFAYINNHTSNYTVNNFVKENLLNSNSIHGVIIQLNYYNTHDPVDFTTT